MFCRFHAEVDQTTITCISLHSFICLWVYLITLAFPQSLVIRSCCFTKHYRNVAAVNLYGLTDVTMTYLLLVKLERGRIFNTSSRADECSSDMFTVRCFEVRSGGFQGRSDVSLRNAILFQSNTFYISCYKRW